MGRRPPGGGGIALTTMGRLYISGIIAAGVATILHSLYVMLTASVGLQWYLLAALTLLSGTFTVRVPTISARLSVSETFVFAAVLFYGPAHATLIVVFEILVISVWQGPRSTLERVLFNASAPALAIWTASQVFYATSGIAPLVLEKQPVLSLVPALLALAAAYFLINTWLVAIAIAFQKRASAFAVWLRNFSWLSLNYFSGASLAALLLPYLYVDNRADLLAVAGIVLPLLAVSYVTLRTALGRVEDANRHLSELNKLYLSTIETLAMAIDAKDQITHGHIRRVQIFAVGLAKAIGVRDEAQIRAIEAAALLHDMGKLAVPEYILNKPGPLTAAEFEKMKLHASVGADILSAIEFPYPVVPIVRHHHECWNGTGYPDGLRGTEIPIGARVLSVVDCFDALTSDRPYRPRLSDREAIRILIERRGSMYDPLIVDVFQRVYAELTPAGLAPRTQPFAAIANAATPASQYVTRTQPLDDIAASSEEMLTLFTLARELTGRISLADISDVLLKHLRRLVPASLCVFFLHDEGTTDLVAAHATGENAEAIQGLRIALGERLSGWVAANRRSIRNSDPILDFGDAGRGMKPRLRACLSTPLVSDDRLVGVFSLYSTHVNAFTEEHQRLIEIVSRQVSPVLRRAIEYANASLAFRDPLTGLPNLQHLQQLAEEQNQLGELPTPTSLIYVDVNELKNINVKYGRHVGDQALREVVAQLRTNLRSADVLFRLESDEFAVLLLQTDRETAEGIATRMMTSTQQINSITASKPRANITFSVAVAPEDGRRIEDLVERARRTLLPQNTRPPSSPPTKSIH